MAKKKAAEEVSVKVYYVPIDTAKPNPDNPRKISEAKIKELMESIKELPEMVEFRFLVIDRLTGFLLGGNQRHAAMKRLGYKEIPVAYSDEMTEEQKKEFIIRDNIEAGQWDDEKLKFEFRDFPLVQWGVLPADAQSRQEDKSTVAEAKDIYDNASVKQIVVYFDVKEYNEIMAKMERIREEQYFGDNSEVLLFLIENYSEHESE